VPVGLEKFEALRLARPAIDTPGEAFTHERGELETCNNHHRAYRSYCERSQSSNKPEDYISRAARVLHKMYFACRCELNA